MGALIFGGMARPVFADGKDRSARGVSSRGPFFFGWDYVVNVRGFVGEDIVFLSSNFDLARRTIRESPAIKF